LSAVTRPPQPLHVRQFLTTEECRALLAEIDEHRRTLRRIDGKGGLGPRYSVIGGDRIAASMPRVADAGRRCAAAVAELAGTAIEPFADPVRRARVQTYEEREDGFRWHFDGHQFAAVVTLQNDSEGVTELISPRLSTLVRPLFYPLYAVPQLFSLLPKSTFAAAAGDALFFSGRRHLHRGRSRIAGARTVLVFAFDVAGARPSRIRNWVARWANY
jgi:hypothetical protein